MFRNYLLAFLTVLAFGFYFQTTTAQDDKTSKDEVAEIVDAMTKQCWKMRESNSDSALILGKNALELAKENGLESKLPQLNGYIGVILVHYLYDLVGSIPYFQESLLGSIAQNDSVRLGYAYNNLGDVYLLTGNTPLSLQFSERSLEIFNLIDHNMGIAYGYINMGLVHRNEKNYDLSLDYFQRAATLRKKIGDSTGYASALLEIGRTNLEKGDIKTAMKNYRNSYDRHTEINNKRYTAFCLDGMGKIHYLNKEYKDALEDYLEAIKLNESRMSYYGLIENYIGISLVYSKLDMVEEGENALRNALDISTRLGLRSKILATYETYTEFYNSLKEYRKAAQNSLNFLVLYDSIYSVQQYEILNEIESNYLIQDSLNQAQQQLIYRERERIYLLVIIVLMALIVVVFLWRIAAQRRLNKKLVEVNHTKDKLFSVISHDLRSPFNTIIGFNELLIDDLRKSDNEKTKYYAHAVQSAATDTLNLVNNMLTWSRAQTSNIKFSPVPTGIEDLFNEVSGYFQTKVAKDNITLNFNNETTGEVKLDRTIIHIVLTNLISNSIKYTPSGGRIDATAKLSGKYLIFIISDTGIGISKQMLHLLFNDYSELESTPGVRNEKGTGLGLRICKDLMIIHKGTIVAESKEGEGSTFTVSIPV